MLFLFFLNFFFLSSLWAADVFQTDALYQKSLAKISRQYKTSGFPSKSIFQSGSWIDKTATLNYFCSFKKPLACRKVVFWGTQDASLMVRDHAFSVMKNSRHFKEDEVYSVAAEARDDARNFRHGKPLWLVEKTDRYLRQSEQTLR
jgi:hypothetical protein